MNKGFKSKEVVKSRIDDILEKSKHKEFITVHGKHGDYVRNQTKGSDKDEEVKQPLIMKNTENINAVKDKLFFAFHFEGDFYDYNGHKLPLNEPMKAYAKEMKSGALEDAVIRAHLNTLEGFKDKSPEDQEKAFKKVKYERNKQLREDIIPKIQAVKALEEKLHKKEVKKKEVHKLPASILNRIKYSVKKINEGHNMDAGGAKYVGQNLRSFSAHLQQLKNSFKNPEDITISYKITTPGGKELIKEESLKDLAERVKEKFEDQEFVKDDKGEVKKDRFAQKVRTGKEAHIEVSKDKLKNLGIADHFKFANQVKLHPNDIPILVKDFEIKNLNTIDNQDIDTVNSDSLLFNVKE